MSGNAKSPPEGLKDSECERGHIVNWPPILYVQPSDLNKKQEKTEIKVKLPDGTNYQMVPFQAGNNEDYVTHIIAMHQLLEQKESEDDVAKAFGVVLEIKEQLGPLNSALKSEASKSEKEELKSQITSVKEEMQNARKEALAEIVKAYELICNYFVGKACTQ